MCSSDLQPSLPEPVSKVLAKHDALPNMRARVGGPSNMSVLFGEDSYSVSRDLAAWSISRVYLCEQAPIQSAAYSQMCATSLRAYQYAL